MFNKYPTDTTFGNKDVTKIIDDAKSAVVQGEVEHLTNTMYGRILGVYTDIKDFTQPVTFIYEGDHYAAYNPSQRFSNGADRDMVLNAIKSYLILQANVEGGRLYRSDYQITGKVFTRLISNNITRSYNLTPEQSLKIEMILADYYNWLLMAGDEGVDEETRITGILKFSRATSDQASELARLKLQYEGIDNVAKLINDANISPKLKRFNGTSLLTMVSGIIHGHNAKEDIAISMEYPPIWTWLVYRSLSNISYKNTLLGKTALIVAKQRDSNAVEFTKTLNAINHELE